MIVNVAESEREAIADDELLVKLFAETVRAAFERMLPLLVRSPEEPIVNCSPAETSPELVSEVVFKFRSLDELSVPELLKLLLLVLLNLDLR